MNPFQYEVVKHPLKTVGNGLVAVDDFVSKALVRKRSRRILDGRKEVITPISPIGKLYRKQPDFLLELQLNDGRKPKKVRIYKLFPFRSLIFDFFLNFRLHI